MQYAYRLFAKPISSHLGPFSRFTAWVEGGGAILPHMSLL